MLIQSNILQSEQEFEGTINVRLYEGNIVPLFEIKDGQFADVALSWKCYKTPKKLWEAFIIKRGRVLLREHHKSLNSNRRFEAELKAAQ